MLHPRCPDIASQGIVPRSIATRSIASADLAADPASPDDGSTERVPHRPVADSRPLIRSDESDRWGTLVGEHSAAIVADASSGDALLMSSTLSAQVCEGAR